MNVKQILIPFGALAASLAMSVSASAAEVKPFEVTKFTLQTTEPTREVVEEPSPGVTTQNIVNRPEAFAQAGGHAWGLTTTIGFATEGSVGGGDLHPTQDPKDIVVTLPPGLLGNPNPQAFPRCPLAVALTVSAGKYCPVDTQIGVFRLRTETGSFAFAPIVNVTPEKGQSAEFGLENYFGPTILLTAHVVRVNDTYGLTVVSNEIPSIIELDEVELTFWGVPADPSHDPLRGLHCRETGSGDDLGECSNSANNAFEGLPKIGMSSGLPEVPFLTMPTDCAAGPLATRMRTDSWEEPGRYLEKTPEEPLPSLVGGAGVGFSGCDLLAFGPEVEVRPGSSGADEPVELGVNVKIPQSEGVEGTATPQLRDAAVTLPEGLSISPGIVDGIEACNESGPEGINFSGPESEEIGLNGESQLAPGHCPDASIVGTAKAFTPLLDEPVEGHVYLARPLCGGGGQAPCTERDAADGDLYQLYLELGGQGPLADTGVNLKVRGKVEANPATGQLTTVFENTPQLPFSELQVRLNGGPRSPLDNPAVCGAATTTSDFTPWSAPGITPQGLSVAGTANATPSSYYDVGGCSDPVPFAPGFVAGMVTPQAGEFSAFTLNLARQDREQFVKGIQIHTPPGLLGMLSSVPLCGSVQAETGTCTEASKIGTTRVASGAGSHPFEIEGSVYLTGPYDGAPFGLSIVTDAVAGPFNLGLVIVRARIDVNPENSTLTITTDETGPHAIPQMLDGVPLRLKRVTVDIDRPGFMFNPTNCDQQQITAVISGSGNTSAGVSSPFAVAGCKTLEFKPKFTVSTAGKTSKAGGASLDAKLSYPAGSVGNEANIARVKVDLPKQLPSRLTTLQKACTAQVFEANPANCPVASIVGTVRANTPLLPVGSSGYGLSGPVYFVSHGGEAFPSLIVVLQGDGVRVDLTGSTFISKAGITSSTFKTVPDVPVNTFEIYLPEGKFSALAANGNLCSSKLTMPTELVAQNGAVIHQSTKITVTGCPKPKKAKAKAKKRTKANRANRASQGRAHS